MIFLDYLILNAFLQNVEHGELRGTMSNVGVKLIPKKDDGSNISNWRAISLFSVDTTLEDLWSFLFLMDSRGGQAC